MIKNKNIFFIRHGQALDKVDERIFVDHSEIALSDKGVEQACAVAKELQKPDLIIVSPYLRTVQTAGPIISEFPDVPVELWDCYEFNPLSKTQHYASSRLERRGFHGEYFERNDCEYVNGAEVESFSHFIERVDSILKRLRNIDKKNIVVVSHYWFINAVLMRLKSPYLKITPKYFIEHELDIKNTEIIKIEL
ncbi:MAG: histidine phosphatase family protein [Rickettsiales bacterium]|nr:histidine phosphatase family protein [Rickettsiales bacterium]